MTTQEFKDFCHEEFTNRGFVKRKNMYYLNTDKDVLVSIDLQRSGYGGAYYINYDFHIGKFDDPKLYPTKYGNEIDARFRVMSKDTFEGKHFMGSLIEYELYTIDELKPYFDMEFDEYIMPVITDGKAHIIRHFDRFVQTDNETKEKIWNLLNS